MFKNVGKKIQIVAKVACYIGIIVTVLLGIFCFVIGTASTNDTEKMQLFISGGLLIVCGPLLNWLSSLTMVGFGKLIEDQEETRNTLDDVAQKVTVLATPKTRKTKTEK